jgi:CRP/FNR family transcriptional regulator, cyclic AMP receptor protein
MAPTSSAGPATQIEDVLAHLPITATTQYRKGELIYGPNRDSMNIYLVVAGSVGISRIAEEGSDILFGIVTPDELFGESAFVGDPGLAERATALEAVRLMSWTVADIEDLVAKRPRLAVGLLQILAHRNAELTRQISSFATDCVERRLARSLLHLSERLGTQTEDGSLRMMPFTHSQLSRYVGTSREVVTQYMNRFRKQGLLSYSRSGIALRRDMMQDFLVNSVSGSAGSVN